MCIYKCVTLIFSRPVWGLPNFGKRGAWYAFLESFVNKKVDDGRVRCYYRASGDVRRQKTRKQSLKGPGPGTRALCVPRVREPDIPYAIFRRAYRPPFIVRAFRESRERINVIAEYSTRAWLRNENNYRDLKSAFIYRVHERRSQIHYRNRPVDLFVDRQKTRRFSATGRYMRILFSPPTGYVTVARREIDHIVFVPFVEFLDKRPFSFPTYDRREYQYVSVTHPSNQSR